MTLLDLVWAAVFGVMTLMSVALAAKHWEEKNSGASALLLYAFATAVLTLMCLFPPKS